MIFSRRIGAATAIAFAAILIPAVSAAADSTPPGKIGFKAQNKMFKADGEFKNWRFTKVDIPGGDIEKGSVEIEIETTSVEANNPKLTNHLKQDDMLKSAGFPKATVRISDAKKTGDDAYQANVSLTLRGVTKTLPATFKVLSKSPLKIEGEAVVDRVAFGVYLPYNPNDGKSVEPDVKITLQATVPDKL